MRPFAYALLCVFIGITIFLITTTVQAVQPIRLMSLNIKADFNFGVASNNEHAWIDSSGNHRRDLVTKTIQQYAPDLLGVQEAFINQMNDLSNELPNYSHYGVGRNDGLSLGEHCGIFYRSSRFARANQGTFWLSLTPNLPSVHPSARTFRIATWAILQDSENNNEEYFVLNSHWATGFGGTEAREYSAQLIRNHIELLAGDRPVIVMGDLNAFDFQPAMQTLRGEDDPESMPLLDSYRQVYPEQGPNERTNHGWSGNIVGQRIDYLLHSDDFRTNAIEIVNNNFEGVYPSDHYPLTATLAIAPNLQGDLNQDGSVDAADYTVWRDGYQVTHTISDYRNWVLNYGKTIEVPMTIVVSEPLSAMTLFVTCHCLLQINCRYPR